MKNLKFTTAMATASILLLSSTSFAQNNEVVDNDDNNFDLELNCTDPNGNQIEGTPIWSNYTGKIITTSACPTNVKVGIQVTNPDANLHINSGLSASNSQKNVLIIENSDDKILKLSNDGRLFTREVRVNLDQWPDYVFEENYDLISLDSVEKHINTYGYLPNVPSAEKVESSGLNLGESNKFLMEKVEELTLYLIDQKKEQDAIKATLIAQQQFLVQQQKLLLQQAEMIQQISNLLK